MVKSTKPIIAAALLAVAIVDHSTTTEAFAPSHSSSATLTRQSRALSHGPLHLSLSEPLSENNFLHHATKLLTTIAATAILSTSLISTPAFAENELSAKYGGKGFDSTLVDQTCLVDKCSLQAKACLADDPSCRKGLTCTAKCMGDNACITGCMARYGDKNLDNLLKCTIEDHECIKVAILDGGADKYGEEPRAPSPTIRNFDVKSMEGTWFKVVGFNPNYDCYACQRNTFTAPENAGSNLFVSNNKMMMDVEFSMPRMLPDGSPPPPKNVRETIQVSDDDSLFGSQSIGFNDYNTHEVMIFDSPVTPISDASKLLLGKGTNKEATYSRTAHSEGEMFGLKFWENWYVIGENDADEPEFKFIYYNGKTRQNTYEGAFVYSRSKELPQASMAKVYQIARDAGMNPNNFCKIRNGCFKEDETIVKQPESGLGSPSNPFRGILASTKISQLLGVEPVAAEGYLKKSTISQQYPSGDGRAWWFEVGDYLENPHRHFKAMDSLRTTMEWPQDVKQINKYN
jgi:hypothetical protein